jgi:hypothetical protein
MLDFIFGVLSVIGLMFIGVLIFGMFRIYRIHGRVKYLNDEVGRHFVEFHRRIDQSNDHYNNRFYDIERIIRESNNECIRYVDETLNNIKKD